MDSDHHDDSRPTHWRNAIKALLNYPTGRRGHF